MSVIRATVRNGKIIADAPADWPEGETVELVRVEDRFQDIEADQDDSPEAIKAWIAWTHSLQPIFTPEEEAAWQADLDAQKARDKATFFERAAKLDRLVGAVRRYLLDSNAVSDLVNDRRGVRQRANNVIARVLGRCTVVSCDSDMLAIPGLAVEDWRS